MEPAERRLRRKVMKAAIAVVLLGGMLAAPAAAAYRWESRHHSLFIAATLVLDDDGTYRYTNQTGSCWLDWDDRGKWSESEDGLLVLTSETLASWPAENVSSVSDPSVAGVRVVLLDEAAQPIGGAQVLFGDGTVERATNGTGQVELSPADIARIDGRAEWIAFVSAVGSGFVRATPGANVHTIRLSSPRNQQPHRTHFMRSGQSLTQLGGLRVVLERCR